MNYYGIDLGTSNCLISKITSNLDDTFDVKCLTDNDGEDSFPSVVYFENEKNYKVGETARKHLFTEPDSTVELIKIRLGKTHKIQVKTPSGRFEKSPQEISSYLLSHFNTIHSENIENVVVTVPAFFDQNQKEATMQAGLIADIKPQSLIEEPTAAIMYHIFSEYKAKGINFMNMPKKNVLVFDFGGGTLDLSLIELTKNYDEIVPKVLAIGGDEELGGNNIDFAFTKIILDYLKRKYPDDNFIEEVNDVFEEYYENYIDDHILRFPDDTSNEIKNFIFRLKRNLEQVKMKLSAADEARIVLEGKYRPINIKRESFENKVLKDEDINIEERIKDALGAISRTLKNQKASVHEVLLIGGSSQIPFVKKTIIDALKDFNISQEHIILSDDFEKAVAKGAAIQSAIIAGVPIPPFMYNKCSSIVARDIELEHAGGSKLFIKMGTSYPLEEKERHTVRIGHSLSETVTLKLNEIVDEHSKRQICNFQFYLPIYYTDDPIEISMDIDEAGLYKIEAVHLNTGEAVEFEPNKQYSLSTTQIKDATASAKFMRDIS